MSKELVRKKVDAFDVLRSEVYRLFHPDSSELAGFEVFNHGEFFRLDVARNTYSRRYKKKMLFKTKLVEQIEPLSELTRIHTVRTELSGTIQWSKKIVYSLTFFKGDFESLKKESDRLLWNSFDYTMKTGPRAYLNKKEITKIPATVKEHEKELAALIAANNNTNKVVMLSERDVESTMTYDPANGELVHRDKQGRQIELLDYLTIYRNRDL